MMLLLVGFVVNVNAQSWYSGSNSSSYSQSQYATLTILNRSDYALTIKIMHYGGRGLYRTVYISPRSSSSVSFSASGNFYYKAKAEKGGFLGETLYRKGSPFSIQCDASGYTEASLEFFVSSGGGASGQGISKSEFEKNE